MRAIFFVILGPTFVTTLLCKTYGNLKLIVLHILAFNSRPFLQKPCTFFARNFGRFCPVAFFRFSSRSLRSLALRHVAARCVSLRHVAFRDPFSASGASISFLQKWGGCPTGQNHPFFRLRGPTPGGRSGGKTPDFGQ